MHEVPTDLARRLRQHNQEHVLFGWDRLTPQERQALVEQLAGIDLAELERLYARRDEQYRLPPPERIAPAPVEDAAALGPDTVAAGEEALCAGEVAVLVVAGGQGTRLDFDHPKGMFPIGELSGRTLFHIHAGKVLALSRRYGRPVPFLVMTSPATHDETEAFFKEQNFFGLRPEQVHFFRQGTMPALDLATGRLLLERPGVLFAGPNGHGGALTALADSGLLEELRRQGVRHVFYFQVDNPLVKVADPAFVGRHIRLRAEMSLKVIDKAYPKEKMGVLALIDGRCSVIEYSDLPDAMAEMTGPDGRLVYGAGSPAIHVFDVDFLGRVTRGAGRLPYHVARKKVPCIDAAGNPVRPETENALKFEMFIFDALPLADRWLALRTTREEEFAPVKNKDGIDSPATARQGMRNLFGRWLESAGVRVPRDPDGNVSVPLEIDPTFALDADELRRKLPPGFRVDGPTWLR